MAKNLLEIIDEQIFLSFSGKINILESSKGMFLGSITLREGELLDAKYEKLEGSSALETLFFLELEGRNIKYVVEPERVDGVAKKIHFPFSTIRKKLEEVLANPGAQKDKAPPGHIRLTIDAAIVEDERNISAEEFQVLKTIYDHSKVSEIYKKANLPEYKVTNALVRLREKKVLKVIKGV